MWPKKILVSKSYKFEEYMNDDQKWSEDQINIFMKGEVQADDLN